MDHLKLDPSWHPFEIDASKLCQGDFDRKLILKVWDWDADGSSDLIGVAEVNHCLSIIHLSCVHAQAIIHRLLSTKCLRAREHFN